ncbi:MAG: hypothetical protein ABIL09_22940 [Gemmatimonadota bacterium]
MLAEAIVEGLCRVLSRGFDGLLYAPSLAGERAAAVWTGALAGALATAVFARLVPRAAVTRASADLTAALLEIWLYRRRPRVALRAEAALAAANLRLVAAAALPLAASLLVAAPVLIQAHARFGLEAVPAGSPVVIGVELAAEATSADPASAEAAALSWEDGAGPVVGPVRQAGAGRLSWRLTPERPGAHNLRLQVGPTRVLVPLQVGQRRGSLAPVLVRGARRLLHPRGPALDPGGRVARVTIAYGHAAPGWMGWLGVGSAAGALAAAAVCRRRQRRGRRSP